MHSYVNRSTTYSAWVGWFPVLFYTSVYVGELHKRASPLGPNPDPAAIQALEAEANRLGSRALFYSALLTLAMNILLPFIVSETAKTDGVEARTRSTCVERIQVHLGDLWTISHAVFAGCMLATLYVLSMVFPQVD
jgi:solute carrier family 45 protein 1/2/4